MEVATQQEAKNWNLYKFAHYFKHPELRTKTVNVISLEFSNTKMADLVTRPTLVRQLDWIETVWPKSAKPPKVQLYCLMSVANCFTDFHIDFGGTSVFYHVMSGEKVFYFIPPTQRNLKTYEKWGQSPEQGETFLGDLVSCCYECHLHAGQTLIIPSGWIHAVFTPADSLVIGGNFLQGLDIGMQLAIHQIEERSNVPEKFRFPHFARMQWYAADHYRRCLLGTCLLFSACGDHQNLFSAPFSDNAPPLLSWELDGLPALVAYLQESLKKPGKDLEERVQYRYIPFSLDVARKVAEDLEVLVQRALDKQQRILSSV